MLNITRVFWAITILHFVLTRMEGSFVWGGMATMGCCLLPKWSFYIIELNKKGSRNLDFLRSILCSLLRVVTGNQVDHYCGYLCNR